MRYMSVDKDRLKDTRELKKVVCGKSIIKDYEKQIIKVIFLFMFGLIFKIIELNLKMYILRLICIHLFQGSPKRLFFLSVLTTV